jgi:ribokinase
LKYDVITVGSSTVDVFAHTDPNQSELLKVHEHNDIAYPLGSKIIIKNLNIFTGGGGTNTAVAFSRLGLKTAYLGRIGNDNNGEVIFKNLSDEHVDFLGLRQGISGYSVILDSVHDDRTIFTFKGCNDEFDLKGIDLKHLDTKWFYFSSMINYSFSALEKLALFARKQGIKIAFNPSLYLAKKGSRYMRHILKNCEALICNKEESQALLSTISDNIFHLLAESAKLGPKIVVITDGKNGATCYNTYDKMFYATHPLTHLRIIETTGAGDAFASGFVAGIIRGKSMDISLKIGMLNAESVISALGAKNILLDSSAFAFAEKDSRTVITKHAINPE